MIAAFVASLFHDQNAVHVPFTANPRVANFRLTGEPGACDGNFPAEGLDAAVQLVWELLDVFPDDVAKYKLLVNLVYNTADDFVTLEQYTLSLLNYRGDGYRHVISGFVEEGAFSRESVDWRFRVELRSASTGALISIQELPWATVYGRCS